jgi:hypothetical protein
MASGGSLGQPRRGVGGGPEEGLAGQRRGPIRSRRFTDKVGCRALRFDVIANEVLFPGPRRAAEAGGRSAASGREDNPF